MLAVRFRELNKSQRITSKGASPFIMVVRNQIGDIVPRTITSEKDYLDNFTANGVPVTRDDYEALLLVGRRNFYCNRPRGAGDKYGGVEVPSEGTAQNESMGASSDVAISNEAVAIGDADGNGGTLVFNKTLDANITLHVSKPVLNSVDIFLTRSGTLYKIAEDDGAGNLTDLASLADVQVSGTINYITGALEITFVDDVTYSSAQSGEAITVSYDDSNQEQYAITSTEAITPSSVSIKKDAVEVATDDGLGVISGTGITGTIVGQVITVVFQSIVSPDVITVDYTDNNTVIGLPSGLTNVNEHDFGKDYVGAVGTGDGVEVDFSFSHVPKLFAGTLVIKLDGVAVATDDSFGLISGTGINGSVDYAPNGNLSLTFDNAVTNLEVITVEAREPDDQSLFIITGKNPQEVNHAVKVEPVTSDISNKLFDVVIGIKEGAGYKENARYTVSIDPTVKNGYEDSMFITDVMLNDSLVNVFINENIDVSTMPSYTTDWVGMTGGTNWTSLPVQNVVSAWNIYKKNYKAFPARLLVDCSANPTIGKAVYDIALGNWFQRAILTIPSVKINSENAVEDISAHLTRIKAYRDASGSQLGLNAVYGHASLYDNWIKIADSYNGGFKWVSGIGAIAGLNAESEDAKNLWQSYAGANYGVLNEAIELEFNYDEDIVESLPRDYQINTVALTVAGKIIWGDQNLTTIASNVSVTGVRDILSYVEEAIINVAFYKAYEYNDSDTRLHVTTQIEDFIQPLTDSGAFWKTKVQCDDINNTDNVINSRQLKIKVSSEPRVGIIESLFDMVHYLKGGIDIYE